MHISMFLFHVCTGTIKILLGHYKSPSNFPKLRTREDIRRLPNNELILNSSESIGYLTGWLETKHPFKPNPYILSYWPVFVHIYLPCCLMLCVPSGCYLVIYLFVYLPTFLHIYLSTNIHPNIQTLVVILTCKPSTLTLYAQELFPEVW